MLRRTRIDSTPLWITYMLMAQKMRKQAQWPGLRPWRTGAPASLAGYQMPTSL